MVFMGRGGELCLLCFLALLRGRFICSLTPQGGEKGFVEMDFLASMGNLHDFLVFLFYESKVVRHFCRR